jgi:succinyl-CoA:(S)-malate CoA-transferase subunit A
MPGGPPLTPGSTSLADYMCGLYGAVGILVALRAREQTGRGQVVDIALYEAIFRVLDDLAPTYAQDGTVRGRLGLGTGNACPHGHFATKDERWVALACSSDRMFARLAELMGDSDLARTDRFGYVRQRLAHRDEVDALVSAWIGSRTADEVVAACTKAGVPCAPVNSIADIFEDEHVRARENLIAVPDTSGRTFVLPNTVPRLSHTPGRIDGVGPNLGNANDEIYGGVLGLSDAERARLAKDRII